jgi:hypothetical protein
METVEEKVVKEIDIDDVLSLKVTQISCKWSESLPKADIKSIQSNEEAQGEE